MGFDVAFDAAWWARHWWLLFPILGFAIAFYSMWLDHRRKRDLLDLMMTYAQQGKDPPASLTNAVATDTWGWRESGHPRHGSRFWDFRRAIFLGLLAGAFGYLYYIRPGQSGSFGVAAVILGALAVGFLLMSIFRPKSADAPPPPKTNGH